MNEQPMPTICKNCGHCSTDHAWVSRKCPNRKTYEELIALDEYIKLKENIYPPDEGGA
jgi:predicted Zn-ribbon and HTH transcriptional regulator